MKRSWVETEKQLARGLDMPAFDMFWCSLPIYLFFLLIRLHERDRRGHNALTMRFGKNARAKLPYRIALAIILFFSFFVLQRFLIDVVLVFTLNHSVTECWPAWLVLSAMLPILAIMAFERIFFSREFAVISAEIEKWNQKYPCDP